MFLFGTIGIALGWGWSPYFLGSLSIAIPGTLALRISRMAAYTVKRPELGAASGTAYLLLVAGALLILSKHDVLTSSSGLSTLGLMALPPGLALWVRLGAAKSTGTVHLRAVVLDHWEYGRWSIGSNMLQWVPGNLFYLLLPSLAGIDATAALKALRNLTTPPSHAIWAASASIMPSLVQSFGTTRYWRLVRVALVSFVALGIVFWVFVAAFSRPLLNLLYGGRYLEHGHLLPWLAWLPLLAGVNAIFGAALRAAGNPRAVFRGQLCAALVTVLLGIPLVAGWGITGAAVGLLVGSATSALVMILIVLRIREGREWGNDSETVPRPSLRKPADNLR